MSDTLITADAPAPAPTPDPLPPEPQDAPPIPEPVPAPVPVPVAKDTGAWGPFQCLPDIDWCPLQASGDGTLADGARLLRAAEFRSSGDRLVATLRVAAHASDRRGSPVLRLRRLARQSYQTEIAILIAEEIRKSPALERLRAMRHEAATLAQAIEATTARRDELAAKRKRLVAEAKQPGLALQLSKVAAEQRENETKLEDLESQAEALTPAVAEVRAECEALAAEAAKCARDRVLCEARGYYEEAIDRLVSAAANDLSRLATAYVALDVLKAEFIPASLAGPVLERLLAAEPTTSPDADDAEPEQPIPL